MTYRDWERCPGWETRKGQRVYPLYSWGAPSDKARPGGKITAFAADVEPEDSEFPEGMTHWIGEISWVGNVVEWVQVNESRQGEGIATEMFHLARTFTPALRHADLGHLSEDARGWIAAIESGFMQG